MFRTSRSNGTRRRSFTPSQSRSDFITLAAQVHAWFSYCCNTCFHLSLCVDYDKLCTPKFLMLCYFVFCRNFCAPQCLCTMVVWLRGDGGGGGGGGGGRHLATVPRGGGGWWWQGTVFPGGKDKGGGYLGDENQDEKPTFRRPWTATRGGQVGLLLIHLSRMPRRVHRPSAPSWSSSTSACSSRCSTKLLQPNVCWASSSIDLPITQRYVDDHRTWCLPHTIWSAHLTNVCCFVDEGMPASLFCNVPRFVHNRCLLACRMGFHRSSVPPIQGISRANPHGYHRIGTPWDHPGCSNATIFQSS